MSHWINRRVLTLAFAAVAGCDRYEVVAGMSEAARGEQMPPAFQVGDTVQFYAREVFVCSCDDPGDPVAPSVQAPGEYRWAGSDRAFSLGHGRFVMRKIGDVSFAVSTNRASAYSFVSYIGPRVSGVRFSSREIAVATGDSAVTAFDAIDSAGAPIADYRSVFYSMLLQIQPDQTTALAFRKLGGRIVVLGRSPGETVVIGYPAIWNASQLRDTLRVTVK